MILMGAKEVLLSIATVLLSSFRKLFMLNLLECLAAKEVATVSLPHAKVADFFRFYAQKCYCYSCYHIYLIKNIYCNIIRGIYI